MGEFMNILIKNTVFFIIGGLGYGVIEILWRGYTHWAMLIAGGLCFIIFSYIAENFQNSSRLYKVLICALCITEVELMFGIIFNIILKMGIWDYSRVPFNILGQICLPYTFLWGVLSFIIIPLAELINRIMNTKLSEK